MLKILAVEDDPLFAVDIEMCIDALGYELLGIYDKGEEALAFLEKNPADMLVCDIQLKGALTGLDVAKWAGDKQVPVVFVTSFQDDETFNKAKALAPCAYIIKPFDKDDLQRALELAAVRADEIIAKKQEAPEVERPLFVKHKGKLIKVKPDDILYIVSDGNYATFVTSRGKYVVKRSLLQIFSSLPKDVFIRIHRSYLVKFDSITDVFPESQEVGIGEERIPIGRAYKADLMERLQVL